MIRTVVNLVLLNLGWFACILGAAHGGPWLGVAAVTVIAAVHVFLAADAAAEIRLFAVAAILGYAVDSIVVLAGAIEFPPQAALGRPSTIWMVAMWVNLAGTLRVSLGWLRGRWLLAAAVGAVAGPLAYWSGAKLGAVRLGDPVTRSLVLIAVEWGASLPALYALEAWTRSPAKEDGAT